MGAVPLSPGGCVHFPWGEVPAVLALGWHLGQMEGGQPGMWAPFLGESVGVAAGEFCSPDEVYSQE